MSSKEEITLWDSLGLRYASGLSPSRDLAGYREIQLNGQKYYLPQGRFSSPPLPNGSRYQRNESGIWVDAEESDSISVWSFPYHSVLRSVLRGEPSTEPEAPLEYRQRETPAIGYRSWTAKTKKKDGKWTGILIGHDGFEWQKDAASRAACKGNRHKKNPSPALDCMCGLYGWSKPRKASDGYGSFLFQTNVVNGAVMAWGRVLEYADGFRAEYAKPTALYIENENDWYETRLAELVSESYGIPLVPMKEIVSYMTEFGEPLAEGLALE